MFSWHTSDLARSQKYEYEYTRFKITITIINSLTCPKNIKYSFSPSSNLSTLCTHYQCFFFVFVDLSVFLLQTFFCFLGHTGTDSPIVSENMIWPGPCRIKNIFYKQLSPSHTVFISCEWTLFFLICKKIK